MTSPSCSDEDNGLSGLDGGKPATFVSDDPTGGGEPGGFSDGRGCGEGHDDYPTPETYTSATLEGIQDADFVQFDAGRLYIASPRTGFAVVDLTDPKAPKVIVQQALAGRPLGLLVHRGYAFVLHMPYARLDGVPERPRLSVLGERDRTFDEVKAFDLPGPIVDAWIDGANLLVVSDPGNVCDACAATAVSVTSVFLGDLPNVSVAAERDFSSVVDAAGRTGVFTPRVGVASGAVYVASAAAFDGGPKFTLRRVDVSSRDGTLKLGATAPLRAQVDSRHQMRVTSGTLVVVDNAQNDAAPVLLETFDVSRAGRLAPSGAVVDGPALASLACAGTRCYSRTGYEGEQGIVMTDVAARANPVLGEERSGSYVYLAPRGARVLGMSYSEVALFETDLSGALVSIAQSSFGDRMGETDLLHLHHALRSFESDDLVTIPVGGGGTSSAGVRLLDVSADALVARGLAPLAGARRAFLVSDERLVAVSEDALATFDIHDRASPRALAALRLAAGAQQVARTGDVVVSLNFDGLLAFRSLDPDRIAPVGTLDLAREFESFTSSRLVTRGDSVVLSWAPGTDGKREFAVIDASDPQHPTIAGHGSATLPAPVNDGGGYNDAGEMELPPAQVEIGHGVLVGTAMVIPEYFSPPARSRYDDARSRATVHLFAVDLSDPHAIGLASTVAIEEGYSRSALFVDANVLFTTHAEPAPGEDKLRYFVDRIDYTDPARPQRMPAVNVPGALLAVLPGGRRVITVDYHRQEEKLPDDANEHDACRSLGGYASAQVPQGTRTCVRVARTLRVVDIGATGARLVASFEPKGAWVGDLAVGADRIWLLRRSDPGQVLTTLETLVIGENSLESASSIDLASGVSGGLFTDPAMTMVAVGGSACNPWDDATHPRDGKIGVTAIYDTADARAPRVVAFGPPGGVLMTPGAAIVAAGAEGAVVLSLPTGD